jgi:hypothetical protein
MFLSLQPNDQNIRDLIEIIGDILIENQAMNADVLTAVLFIAVNVCDDMEMSKQLFMINCDNMYDSQSRFAQVEEGNTIQ